MPEWGDAPVLIDDGLDKRWLRFKYVAGEWAVFEQFGTTRLRKYPVRYYGQLWVAVCSCVQLWSVQQWMAVDQDSAPGQGKGTGSQPEEGESEVSDFVGSDDIAFSAGNTEEEERQP